MKITLLLQRFCKLLYTSQLTSYLFAKAEAVILSVQERHLANTLQGVCQENNVFIANLGGCTFNHVKLIMLFVLLLEDCVWLTNCVPLRKASMMPATKAEQLRLPVDE